MNHTIEKDRAGLVPYAIYFVYTIYMTVISITYNWESWIPAVINCGMIASIGLRIIYGKKHHFPKLFTAVMVWVNIGIYVVNTQSFSSILGSIAAVVVMLSLFDLKEINYLSMAATVLLFVLYNIALSRVQPAETNREIEFVMQLVGILLLEMLESSLLKNRIRRDREFVQTMKELEEAQHGKDDFMANISHEIRTPLNAIIGISNELMEMPVDENVKEKIFDLTIAGRSLMSLVSDILDFSELQNDTMELIEEPYNITSIINDVVNMAYVWNKEKNLELIVDCEADIPNSLLGDSQKIYRIILNLINNAIKFTDDGCVILFVGARKEEYGVNLMVKIQDTGIGMKEEEVAALENAYNQVDTTRDRRSGGVGLGLAISRKLVGKMNGHMHIFSTPNIGTTVSLIIPQKALTDIPLVSVHESEKKSIIFYMDLERYSYAQIRDGYLDSINRMITQLKVHAIRCATMHELRQRIKHGKFGFLFIADIEYLADKTYFDEMAEQLKVIVMASRDFDLQQAGKNVQLIYRPMHVFSIAAILNGETLEQSEYDYRWNKDRIFIMGAKVLVVDDSAMNLKVVSNLLNHYGISIDTALSGKEAIEKVSKYQYDLLFMDHMMPEMDGVECMHKIHELSAYRRHRVPIVALTANAISGAREMLMREGFDDFVAKPIEKFSMERVLTKFLNSYIVSSEESERITQERIMQQEKEMLEENGKEESTDRGLAGEAELQVEGIDYKLGLSYFGNDKEDYLDIVKCFFEQGLEQIERLEEFYQEKDWKNYRILVHSVKGQSLTIGAKNLSEKAKDLQMAAEKQDASYLLANHPAFITEYRKIVEGIAEYIQGPAEADLRQKLLDAFECFDQEAAVEILERIKNGENGPLSDEDRKRIAEISDQIAVFDFISATDCVKRWGGEEDGEA